MLLAQGATILATLAEIVIYGTLKLDSGWFPTQRLSFEQRKEYLVLWDIIMGVSTYKVCKN